MDRRYDVPRFENIEFLIEGNGAIIIGRAGPSRCAVTADDEEQSLAMLVRRDDETLLQPMARLDAANAKALEDNVYIDEINNGTSDAF